MPIQKRSKNTLGWLIPSLLLAAGCRSAEVQDPSPSVVEPLGPPISDFDFLRSELELRLGPIERRIDGRVRYSVAPRNSAATRLELALDGPEVQGVKLVQGEPLAFEQSGGRVEIQLPPGLAAEPSFEFEIEYGGLPGGGLWFEGLDSGGLFAATRAVAEGAGGARMGWLPTPLDEGERLTASVTLELPLGWTAMAPGERVETSELEDRVIERFEAQREFPLAWLGFAAGRFEVTRLEAGPLRLVVLGQGLPSTWVQNSLARAPQAVAFLERAFGKPYPAQRFTLACLPQAHLQSVLDGAVLPADLIGDQASTGEGNANVALCEVLARQFLGAELTPAVGHSYLELGLARYLALQFLGEIEGQDRFDRQLRLAQKAALEAPSSLVGFDLPRFGEEALIARAVSRLHLLHQAIGPAAFAGALRDFAQANPGRRVTTRDLQASMELLAKQDLKVLFQDWFLAGGDPSFKVSWRYDSSAQEVLVEIQQTQAAADFGAPAVFHAPIEIEVSAGPRTQVERVVLDARKQVVRLASAEKPTWVRFDRDNACPKRLDLERSGEEWLAIAARCPDPRGREEAMVGLGRLVRQDQGGALSSVYRAQLIDRALRDGSTNVRLAAVVQLASIPGLETRTRLEQIAVRDKDFEVRAAALESLKRSGPDAELKTFANARFTDAPTWGVKAAAAGLYVAAAPQDAQRWLLERLVIESPDQRLRADLLRLLGQLPGSDVDDLLLRWARDRQASERVRVAAIEALGARRPKDQAIGTELASLLSARERPVRLAVVEALATRRDERSRAALQSLAGAPVSPEERRAIEAGLQRE